MNKTNAIRQLDTNNISYEVFEYPTDGALDAVSVAGYLKENPEQVFKTLVTVGSSKTNYVFVVPGNNELDLKKAAKAVNEKSIEMIPQKTLLPLTGYIHGGCSPIGMKKLFKTVIDETAVLFDYIYVSAGKIGMQIKINPNDLIKLINGEFVDIKKI
ncbi:MAG: Cys-tRNA(Pro) deacylase [Erysipelotrichaceae bacterium]|nr:Cys-tRNA(Pro) deacylase [Erysipelotrichaceae bacterium]